MSKHIATAMTFDIDGEVFKIDSGARWDASESTVDETVVTLTNCKDDRLDGLTIAWDWTQGSNRLRTKRERVDSLITDHSLIESAIEAELE